MVAVFTVALIVWLAALLFVAAKFLWSISDLRPSSSIVSYYHPIRQRYYRSHPRLGHYVQPRHPVIRAAGH